MDENYCCTNYTNYHFCVDLAKAKILHEEEYPESKRGKYNRMSLINKNDQKSITANFAVMTPFQKSNSFYAKYSLKYIISNRLLHYKLRIGFAILNKELSSETIHLFKQDKVSQDEVLSILKEYDSFKKQVFNKKAPKKQIKNPISEKQTPIEKETKKGIIKNKAKTKVNKVKKTIQKNSVSKNEEIREIKTKIPPNKAIIKKIEKQKLKEKESGKKIKENSKKNKIERPKEITEYRIDNGKTYLLKCPHCSKDLILGPDENKKSFPCIKPLNIKN